MHPLTGQQGILLGPAQDHPSYYVNNYHVISYLKKKRKKRKKYLNREDREGHEGKRNTEILTG